MRQRQPIVAESDSEVVRLRNAIIDLCFDGRADDVLNALTSCLVTAYLNSHGDDAGSDRLVEAVQMVHALIARDRKENAGERSP